MDISMLPPIPDGLEYTTECVAGTGIRATRDWTRNDYIGPFVGVSMGKPEFRQKYGKNIQHVYWTRANFKNTKVIVAKEQRNFITYINEGIPNVFLKMKALWCLTDISAGQELLLKYDAHYPRDYLLSEAIKADSLS
jgi:hypothetical protein